MITELNRLEELLKEAKKHQQAGDFLSAHRNYEVLLSAQPNNVGVLTQLAILNLQLKKLPEARLRVETALNLAPKDVNLLNIAAVIFQNFGEVSKALECYKKASELAPQSGPIRNNLGQLYLELGDLPTAESELSKAVALSPKLPEAWSNKGSVHKIKGEFTQAIECQRHAIELKPSFADAHYNLGNALKEIGNYPDSEKCYNQCLTLSPQHKGAQSGLGLIKLVQGDYAAGLPLFEYRLDINVQKTTTQPTHLIKWQGDEIPNKKIIVTHEQGLGDQIHCVRFAPILRDMGFQVYWQTPSVLKALFNATPSLFGIEWINEEEIPSDCTHYTPIMSLLWNLDIDPATQVGEAYLNSENTQLNSEQRVKPSGLKVGLCWQGNPDNPTDYKRSIPWPQLSTLLELEGIEFYSLQKGVYLSHDDINAGKSFQQEVINNTKDFSDTASLIQKLDLVISVDTAVLHLAGALGIPSWGLLAYINDWRWGLICKETPWYKGMILYRQSSDRSWDSVITSVFSDLKNKTKN